MVTAEAFDVKLDSRFDVRQRFRVAVTLTNHHALQSEWIRDVPIRVVLYDDFDRSLHIALCWRVTLKTYDIPQTKSEAMRLFLDPASTLGHRRPQPQKRARPAFVR